MKKPKAINLFIDCYEELAMFSDEQAGRLVKALLLYANEGVSTDFSDDLALRVTFSRMAKQINRDFEKYRDICEKRSKAGKRGSQALCGKGKAANAGKCRQEEKEEEYEEENKYKEEDEEENKYKKEDEEENKYEYDDKKEPEALSAAEQTIVPLEFLSDVYEIVDYLNDRANASFRAVAYNTGRSIANRLESGSTVEDCKRAIDRGCALLEGTDLMRGKKQMLPYRLFGIHFDEYAYGSSA